MRCDGSCGQELSPEDPVVEVDRTSVFCMACAIFTTAGLLREVYEHDLHRLQAP